MARKEALVVVLLWALMAAFLVMSASATASGRLQTAEHMAHPQGDLSHYSFGKDYKKKPPNHS